LSVLAIVFLDHWKSELLSHIIVQRPMDEGERYVSIDYSRLNHFFTFIVSKQKYLNVGKARVLSRYLWYCPPAVKVQAPFPAHVVLVCVTLWTSIDIINLW
ncbi:hypothetical protein scyTo_0022843, partial [Scyliorhinus torazame]|nr:hypothetical protein [Scyliorhinus torazame]